MLHCIRRTAQRHSGLTAACPVKVIEGICVRPNGARKLPICSSQKTASPNAQQAFYQSSFEN
jgi:hypothetical protein